MASRRERRQPKILTDPIMILQYFERNSPCLNDDSMAILVTTQNFGFFGLDKDIGEYVRGTVHETDERSHVKPGPVGVNIKHLVQFSACAEVFGSLI